MFKINIYTMTDIKGPRRRDGYYAYIAEMPTEKGLPHGAYTPGRSKTPRRTGQN